MATIPDTQAFLLNADISGFTVVPASGQSWKKGQILTVASGEASLMSDGSKVGLCMAASKHPDSEYEGTDGRRKPVYLLNGGITAMQVKTGDTGGNHVLVAGNLNVSYGISIDANGLCYVNVADTTDVAVRVLGPIGDYMGDGVGYGKVGDTNVVCAVQFLDAAVLGAA